MLVEREDGLATLAAAHAQAMDGHGRLVFVGGEAGVGKTTIVTEFARRAPADVQVRRGVSDNLTTALALGSLVEAVPELSDFVDRDASVDRPRLFRRLRGVVATAPTLLILEDVHWADEATLEMLRFLGRRLDGLRLLVLATYRSEEVSPRHPLAIAMGELTTAPGVDRLTVEPLSAVAVHALVAESGTVFDAAQLHERTGGNAFYVTEVLAAPSAGEVPGTVRDAVLARLTRLSGAGRDILAAAAVLGRPADARLLADVAARSPGDVDECVERGLLVRERTGWAFRHELARDAVEQTLLPAAATALHRHALDALVARNVDEDRRLAHHAALAGQGDRAGDYAARAAARAARLGAHREAVEQYRMALRFHAGDASAREQLLVALSYECYLTDDPEDALTARLKAMELAELAGATQSFGRHQRWVSRLSWFLGRNADSERYALRAIATLEPDGEGHELAMAYSNQAQLCMLGGDVDGAERWGGRALAIARRTRDREVEIHALNNIGSALSQRSDSIEGRTFLQRSLDLALADDAHEHVARAYTNLGSTAVTNRHLSDAVDVLRAGIGYCADRDLDSWRLYMSAHLARTLTEQGHYDAADDCARDVLRHPQLSPISAIVAMAASAQIALRRGTDARPVLTAAWDLARGTGEAQRLTPVAVAAAEARWLAGNGHADTELDIAWAAVNEHPVAWEVAEVAYWRDLAGLPATPPVPLPEPFALLLERNWPAAAEAWDAIGCPLWRAYALARDESVESAREALAVVDELGAAAVRAAILRVRHEAGLPVPRGPRGTTSDNPAALTPRELEVLQLVAAGLSNADVAARLYLSEKTVGHHVSAVLRKIGQPSRGRAAAWAVQHGLVGTAPEPTDLRG
jgi:DNA-binding CsgD family transcriptional regulator/tetratricopeptide (TPR) repeat protein